MKKKVSVLLLCLLILPLSLLFGCGETVSYTFYSKTSSTAHGDVSTVGTYTEGETVSITAVASKGSSCLGWVKDETELVQSGSTYSIKNTTDTSTNLVTKSVLSFSSSSATQGTYTAVFSEENVLYVKLSSVYFTKDLSTTPASSSTAADDAIFSVTSMTISQGSAANLTNVISVDSLSASDGIYLAENDISNNNLVMKLDDETAKYVRVNLSLVASGQATTSRYTLQAAVYFPTEEMREITDYEELDANTSSSTGKSTYHVEYNTSGTYKIVFTFTLSGETYYMVTTYTALS